MKTTTAFSFVLFVLWGAPANAVVTIDWATVGNPGNAPDQLYTSENPDNLRFGSVAYTYRISKYEVTNDQYSDFLNAVDPAGTNPHNVYTTYMGPDYLGLGWIAFDSGAAAGAKYSSKPNMGNKPVNYASFLSCMRFVNWLENGQPIDGSGTESGVYTIGTGVSETRAPGATYFIPSEDEWYKAAYHQPAAQGGDADDYWLYPTASNTVPTIATANAVGDISNPGMNVANYDQGADWNGQDGNVTTVGTAGAGSASFYGTFDQGGNLWEWNEAVIGFSARSWRGGHWVSSDYYMTAQERRGPSVSPRDANQNIGFRVASISEPSSPSGVSFQNIHESSGTDPVPLYGLPSQFPGGLNFNPTSLVATGQDGTADTTDGRLRFTVTSGSAINAVSLSEAGDFTLLGVGTTSQAAAVANLAVTVTEIDGLAVTPIELLPANAAANRSLLTNPGIVQPWSLGALVDVAGQLGPGQNATRIDIVVENALSAMSEPGNVAFISMLDFMFHVATSDSEANVMVLAGLAATGDFNEDGIVEASDLSLWRSGFATTDNAIRSQGDANYDGNVDGADFLTWQRNLGVAPGASSGATPAPEANGATLGAIAAGLLIAFPRRQHCRSSNRVAARNKAPNRQTP